MPRPHPAKGELAVRRISNRQVAAALELSEQHTGRVLNGFERVSPRFRRKLSKSLGLPANELFHDDDELVGGRP